MPEGCRAVEGWRTRLERGTRQLELPVLGPGAAALARWRLVVVSTEARDDHDLIFAGARADGEPLTDQQIRNLVRAATGTVGFEHAGRAELRSAFAAWCRATFDLTDYELAQVLGTTDVGTVDRLLAPQRALEWQRRIAADLQKSEGTLLRRIGTAD